MTNIKLTTKTEGCAYIFTGQGTARWFIDKRGNPRPLFNILSMEDNNDVVENRDLRSLPWDDLVERVDYAFVLYESKLDDPVRGEGLCRITDEGYELKTFHFFIEIGGKEEYFCMNNVMRHDYEEHKESWKYIIRYES